MYDMYEYIPLTMYYELTTNQLKPQQPVSAIAVNKTCETLD